MNRKYREKKKTEPWWRQKWWTPKDKFSQISYIWHFKWPSNVVREHFSFVWSMRWIMFVLVLLFWCLHALNYQEPNSTTVNSVLIECRRFQKVFGVVKVVVIAIINNYVSMHKQMKDWTFFMEALSGATNDRVVARFAFDWKSSFATKIHWNPLNVMIAI